MYISSILITPSQETPKTKISKYINKYIWIKEYFYKYL